MKTRLLFILTLITTSLLWLNAQIITTGNNVTIPAIVGDTAPYTHLQGVCTNNSDKLYFSFNSKLIQTDLTGKVLRSTLVTHHHGDICYNNGKLYVAVEFGNFNDAAGTSNSRVYEYDSETLDFIKSYTITQTIYGCGGIATDGTRFILVGGLPSTGFIENYLYEYDMNFQFVAKHTLASGYTTMGIQTACYANNKWWFGTYGTPNKVLRTDNQFGNLAIFNFSCAFGIAGISNGNFIVADEVITGGLTFPSTVGYKIVSEDATAGLKIISNYPVTYGEFVSGYGIQNADITTCDIDNDGDLDVLASGELNGDRTALFINNNDGTYTRPTSLITGGKYTDIKFGDIDGDGDIDIIYNGKGYAANGKAIALNNGTGTFSRTTMDVTPAQGSCGFADFDNNGFLDYFVIGDTTNVGTIFFQNKTGTFTKDQTSFSSYMLLDPDATILDFNKDGFADIFISAGDNITKKPFCGLFINDGTGKFTISVQPNLIQKAYGSNSWGDVDGDGWLDLLLNGDGGIDGEASNNYYRLYRNNAGVLEPKIAFNDFTQKSIGDGSRMVDWDNDGDLDLIFTGWSDTKNQTVTMLYLCTNASNFAFQEVDPRFFPGLSESSIDAADLNNDGKIDLILTGYSGGAPGNFNRRLCSYFMNPTEVTNNPPSASSALNQEISLTNDVTFSWNAATDDLTPQNSLTYNLYLKNTTTGKWLYNPMANMTTGWRKVSDIGNMFLNKTWTLKNLPEGSYEWTVQAIDANFRGGAFAPTKSFTVSSTSNVLDPIMAEPQIYSIKNKLIVNHFGDLGSTNIQIFGIDGVSISYQKLTTATYSLELPKGIYIVRITDSKSQFIRRILIN